MFLFCCSSFPTNFFVEKYLHFVPPLQSCRNLHLNQASRDLEMKKKVQDLSANLPFHLLAILNVNLPFHQLTFYGLVSLSPNCFISFLFISSCSFINFPFHHFILLTCCFINVLFHQLALMPKCHFINLLFHQLSFHQHNVLLMWGFITLPFHKELAVESTCLCQIAISSTCHFINSTLYQLNTSFT
jgi:hypothetical protein